MSMADMPDKPLDFLGEEIEVGHMVVYPTGGTSCRMVSAEVIRIEDRIDEFLEQRRKDGGKYWSGPRNGHTGPARFRLVVHRRMEGTRDQYSKYWPLDTTREVRIDQLHRVVDLDQV